MKWPIKLIKARKEENKPPTYEMRARKSLAILRCYWDSSDKKK